MLRSKIASAWGSIDRRFRAEMSVATRNSNNRRAVLAVSSSACGVVIIAPLFLMRNNAFNALIVRMRTSRFTLRVDEEEEVTETDEDDEEDEEDEDAKTGPSAMFMGGKRGEERRIVRFNRTQKNVRY